MKNLRKGISVILVFCLLTAMLSVSAFALSLAVERLLGDANNDGIVDVGDATFIQQAIAYMLPDPTDPNEPYLDYEKHGPQSIEFKAADVNKDSLVNVGDATLIQMWTAMMPEADNRGISEPIESEPAAPSGDDARISIYDLKGNLDQTLELNIGDQFTVITYLNAADINGGKIQSLDGRVSYTAPMLKLVLDDPEFFEDDMFPLLTSSRLGITANYDVDAGDGIYEVQYNASDAKRYAVFDNDNAVLTLVRFEVTEVGEGIIRNSLVTLAGADEDLTKIIDHGELIEGFDYQTRTIVANYVPAEPVDHPTQAPTAQPTEPLTEPTEPTAPVNPTEPTSSIEPTEPTEPVTEPTDPVTEPTEPVTEDPTVTPTIIPTVPTEPSFTGDDAEISIYDLEGNLSQTINLNIGDQFTVLTYLNIKDINDGKIRSIDGRVIYTSPLLKLVLDDPVYFEDDMFPLLSSSRIGITANYDVDAEDGTYEVRYNASDAKKYATFASDDAVLTKVRFEVTASGKGVVRNTLVTLASADDDLTRIVNHEQLTEGFSYNSQRSVIFGYDPADPTTVPTDPTEPATNPTEPATDPTEPATEPTQPTEPPTEDETKEAAVVKLYDLEGELAGTYEGYAGDTFTVYTYLNLKDINNGRMLSMEGKVSYTDPNLEVVVDDPDEYEDDMFPVLTRRSGLTANYNAEGDEEGTKEVIYNYSSAQAKNACVFDSDDAVLTKITFRITSGGESEIRNYIRTMAAADDYLTRVMVNYQFEEGFSFTYQKSVIA